jgi:hypothetical protein
MPPTVDLRELYIQVVVNSEKEEKKVRDLKKAFDDLGMSVAADSEEMKYLSELYEQSLKRLEKLERKAASDLKRDQDEKHRLAQRELRDYQKIAEIQSKTTVPERPLVGPLKYTVADNPTQRKRQWKESAEATLAAVIGAVPARGSWADTTKADVARAFWEETHKNAAKWVRTQRGPAPRQMNYGVKDSPGERTLAFLRGLNIEPGPQVGDTRNLIDPTGRALARTAAEAKKAERGAPGTGGGPKGETPLHQLGRRLNQAAMSAGFAASAMSYAIANATRALFGWGEALVAETQRTAEYGLEVRRQADALGVTTDQYQELTYASKKYGVEMTKISDAMVMLSSRALQAQEGNKTQAQNFSLLGLSSKDLKNKNALDLLLQMSDAFKGAEVPVARLAAAQRLLGNANAKVLLPMLRQGSRGFREMAAEARRLGLIMSEEDLKASKSFSDQMLIVSSDFDVLKRTISFSVMPALEWWGRTLDNLYHKTLKPLADHLSGRLLLALGGVAAGLGAVSAAALALTGTLLLAMPVFTAAAAALSAVGVAAGLAAAPVEFLAAVLAALFGLLTVAFVAEWAVIIGSLVAIGLAIDDIITYTQGGRSMIGDFFAAFENQDSTLGAVARLLRVIVDDLVKTDWKGWGETIMGVIRRIGHIVDINLVSPLRTAFGLLQSPIDAAANSLRGYAINPDGSVAGGKMILPQNATAGGSVSNIGGNRVTVGDVNLTVQAGSENPATVATQTTHGVMDQVYRFAMGSYWNGER